MESKRYLVAYKRLLGTNFYPHYEEFDNKSRATEAAEKLVIGGASQVLLAEVTHEVTARPEWKFL